MKPRWLLIPMLMVPLAVWGSAQAQPPTIGPGARPSPQDVLCRTFDDGYTHQSPLSDAVYLRAARQACIPDGTPTGNCHKWFGRCQTRIGRSVVFKVFNNGNANLSRPADAVYSPGTNSACIPDGTPTGTCRRWFGLPTLENGRAVECVLFNDGYTKVTGPTQAIYFHSNGQVCLPDGTPTGTCRKWFGRCRVT